MLRRSNLRLAAAVFLPLLAALVLLTHSPASAAGRRQEGYPPAEQPTGESFENIQVEPSPTAAPYPASDFDFPVNTPAPIGAQIEAPDFQNAPFETTQPVAQATTPRGVLYLWLGFIATALVFLTSVVGAIHLFIRRNEP